MSDVKRLLDEATPLPWESTHSGPWNAALIDPLGIDTHYADAALIVHAVNHLPAYEAAVEVLERLVQTECVTMADHELCGICFVSLTESAPGCEGHDAREVLRRIRDEMPT